jgi:hypothetical protein
MADAMVVRRRALDTWVKRWVASVQLDLLAPNEQIKVYEELHGPGAWERHTKAALLDKLLVGLLNEEAQVGSMGYEVTLEDDRRCATLRLCVLLESPQGPRKGSAGS